MEESPVFSLSLHRTLLSEKEIQEKYRAAIRRAVRPGEVVLDLGAGSGIHAIFACRAGAKKVYAVEKTAVIEIARAVARENGCANKVSFLYGDSTEIRLPERVDVILNYLGFVEMLRCLGDARKRFLKKGGKFVPRSMRFSLVPLEYTQGYMEKIDFWSKRHYGLWFESFRSRVVCRPAAARLKKGYFLAKPKVLGTVYFTEAVPIGFNWTIEFKMTRRGILHGLGFGCSYELVRGVSISSALSLHGGHPSDPYIFFPLESPLRVKKNQLVRAGLSLHAGTVISEQPIWRWTVELNGHEFQQTNFHSTSLSNSILKKLASRRY